MRRWSGVAVLVVPTVLGLCGVAWWELQNVGVAAPAPAPPPGNVVEMPGEVKPKSKVKLETLVFFRHPDAEAQGRLPVHHDKPLRPFFHDVYGSLYDWQRTKPLSTVRAAYVRGDKKKIRFLADFQGPPGETWSIQARSADGTEIRTGSVSVTFPNDNDGNAYNIEFELQSVISRVGIFNEAWTWEYRKENIVETDDFTTSIKLYVVADTPAPRPEIFDEVEGRWKKEPSLETYYKVACGITGAKNKYKAARDVCRYVQQLQLANANGESLYFWREDSDGFPEEGTSEPSALPSEKNGNSFAFAGLMVRALRLHGIQAGVDYVAVDQKAQTLPRYPNITLAYDNNNQIIKFDAEFRFFFGPFDWGNPSLKSTDNKPLWSMQPRLTMPLADDEQFLLGVQFNQANPDAREIFGLSSHNNLFFAVKHHDRHAVVKIRSRTQADQPVVLLYDSVYGDGPFRTEEAYEKNMMQTSEQYTGGYYRVLNQLVNKNGETTKIYYSASKDPQGKQLTFREFLPADKTRVVKANR